MESSSERNARHLDYNRQVALTEKAHELGIHSRLLGYPQMTAEQRNAVYPQVSLLANELFSNVKLVEQYLLPPFMVLERPPYSYIGGAAAAAAAASTAERAAAQRASAANVYITCRYYIDELDKVEEELDKVEEELERVKEENARLEKENAKLIELLPGRGGSRKRKAMHGSTRRKGH